MTRLLCIAPGAELDRIRARELTAGLQAEVTILDADPAASHYATHARVWQTLTSRAWDLVYLEGTKLACGLALVRAARQWGQRYIVSTGDPIGGFFHVTRGVLHGLAFSAYERLLYRHSRGVVGWTPYLTGAALSLGAPRAATVEGAVDGRRFKPQSQTERTARRQACGIPSDHLVCGVVGSLLWVPRQAYCYGLELVEALKRVRRSDLTVVIVGDGSGRERLEERIPAHLRTRVVFTGRLPAEAVAETMACFDVGFVTQTLDRLGHYRLTTKLPEYLACGVPVAMSPVPGYFDYVGNAGWPLPGRHPASPAFHQELADWLDALTPDQVLARAHRARARALQAFDYEVLRPRFQAFIHYVLADGRAVVDP